MENKKATIIDYLKKKDMPKNRSSTNTMSKGISLSKNNYIEVDEEGGFIKMNRVNK